MISKMRAITPVVMWVVIVAFVGTIFFAWGMDYMGGGGGKKQSAGKIGGMDVALQYFDRKVSMERERLQQQAQQKQDNEEAERGVPRRVWEEEVTQNLLNKAFNEMRLGATADEIFEYLKANPPPGLDTMSYFKTNGNFDTTKYVAFLNNPQAFDDPGMRNLESYTKDMILPGRKLDIMLNTGAVPTKAMIARQYREDNERTIFQYAKVAGLKFPVDSAEISPGRIMQYYQAHQDSFTRENQTDLYVVSQPKVSTPGDEQLIINELLEVKKRVEGKEATFQDEARAESEDPGSAQNGGELGWFGKGMMVPEFETVAFALAPGALSEPFRTSFGYHILMVEEKREKDGKSEVHARHILRKIVPSLETLDSMKTLLDSLRVKMDAEGFKETALKTPGVHLDSSGLFKKGDPLPRFGFVQGLSRFAFDNNQGDISESVFENKTGFYLFQIKRKTRKGVLPLEEVRPSIVASLRDSIRHEKARVYMVQVMARPGSAESLATLSATDSLVVSGVSDTVTRSAYVPALGYRTKAVSAAMALPVGNVSEVIDLADGYCVVKPLWHQTIDSIPWAAPAVATAAQTLKSEQQQRLYYSWISAIRRNTKIVCNIDQFYQE